MIRAPVFSSNCRLVSAMRAAAPAEAQLDRAEIDLAGAHVGMVQDRRVERRYAVEERGLHLRDGLQQIVDVAWIRHERQRVGPDECQRLHPDVGVDVEQRQRQHDDVVPRPLRRLGPLVELQPGSDIMRDADRRRPWACRSCRRSTAPPHDRRGRRLPRVAAIGDAHAADRRSQRSPSAKGDAMAVLLFTKQREEQPQQRRQVLLDGGGDDVPHAGSAPALASVARRRASG